MPPLALSPRRPFPASLDGPARRLRVSSPCPPPPPCSSHPRRVGAAHTEGWHTHGGAAHVGRHKRRGGRGGTHRGAAHTWPLRRAPAALSHANSRIHPRPGLIRTGPFRVPRIGLGPGTGSRPAHVVRDASGRALSVHAPGRPVQGPLHTPRPARASLRRLTRYRSA
jgi:hypothetical protein